MNGRSVEGGGRGRTSGAGVLALAIALFLGVAPAARADGQIGILECHGVAGGYTLLIHSKHHLACVFKSPTGGRRYRGETGIGLGVDLKWNSEETLRFAVIALDPRAGAGSLAGTYLGGRAQVALGLGLGADALIGGGENGIALQPLGIETSKGAGVAAGLGYLTLE